MKDGKVQLENGAVNHPRNLFKPGSWLSKIDFINHLILFNNVLIAVLSEKLGGKTSFAALLKNNLDLQIKSITMTMDSKCNKDKLIQDIANQLHLNQESGIDFASIVTQINERKGHVLLIIDEAQFLPESFIKDAMIAIKSQNDFGFFHMCLLSDHSIVQSLNQLAVDQFNNLIHTIELGSLNESETRTYVLQRAMSYHLINKPLSENQYKQFYQLTKGNIAKINSQLESFLVTCSPESSNKRFSLLKKASLAISASLVAGLSYFYIYDTSYLSDGPEESMVKQQIIEAKNQPINKEPEFLISYIPYWENSAKRQLVQFALPKKQVFDNHLEDEEPMDTQPILDKVVVIPKISAPDQPKATNPIEPPIPVESRLVKIGSTEKKKLGKVLPTKNSPNQYTIQFIASHRVIDIHNLRKSNKLFQNAKVRHFTNQKGTWYILTLGEYSNRTIAMQDFKKLPPELAKYTPWIRSLEGVKHIG